MRRPTALPLYSCQAIQDDSAGILVCLTLALSFVATLLGGKKIVKRVVSRQSGLKVIHMTV